MAKEYSNKNLQKASFKNEDLSNVSFVDSDLRGADFTGANLTGANFTQSRTGITPLHTIIILCAALMVSLLSGYIAALTGQTCGYTGQGRSEDSDHRRHRDAPDLRGRFTRAR